MVTRYWRVTVVGLVGGGVLGAGLFGLLAVTGNPDWRSYLTVDEVVRSTSLYAGIGLLVASAAIVGGWVCVALYDRRLVKRSQTRVSMAAAGAAGGTMVVGLGAGVADMMHGSNSWQLIVPIALVLALVAAIVAALLVSHAERQHARGPMDAAAGSGTSVH